MVKFDRTILVLGVILVGAVIGILAYNTIVVNKTNGQNRAIDIRGTNDYHTIVQNFPVEELSSSEIDWILFMREEEKLARDVYLKLYETWGIKAFDNIARSEQRHMDAIKALIDKYNITDPVINENDIGVFKNPEIQQLYDKLVSEGMKSPEDAIKVGMLIEEKDIYDLREALSQTDNQDVEYVFNQLMQGSENHLRAFYRLLGQYNTEYTCQYISQQDCMSIINS